MVRMAAQLFASADTSIGNTAEITGASSSVIVTVWMTDVATLPLASTADQVMIVSPKGYGSPNGSSSLLSPVAVIRLSQLSLTPGATTNTVAVDTPASVDWLIALTDSITGACVSFTVTVWVTGMAVLAAASTADQVMIVSPNGYGSVRASPSPRTPVAAVAPTLSLTLGTGMVRMAAQLFASADTSIGNTAEITGASSSVIVTVWMTDVATLPLASTADQVMIVSPKGYGSPNGSSSLLSPVAVIRLSQLSLTPGATTNTVAVDTPASVDWLIALTDSITGEVRSTVEKL